VPFIQAEDGYINLLESDIASDKGSALLDEFVKLCEEYELNTWNVEKIITMFPDVSIDDFIYIYIESPGYLRSSFHYEKPNTDPPELGCYDIMLFKLKGEYEDTYLQINKAYIDNAIGLLGDIVGKIRRLGDFYKTCGYTFTNEEIVDWYHKHLRSFDRTNYIVLFNEGGRYKYFEDSDETRMDWAEGAESLKFIHTFSQILYQWAMKKS
jgi:hypothetical protein